MTLPRIRPHESYHDWKRRCARREQIPQVAALVVAAIPVGAAILAVAVGMIRSAG